VHLRVRERRRGDDDRNSVGARGHVGRDDGAGVPEGPAPRADAVQVGLEGLKAQLSVRIVSELLVSYRTLAAIARRTAETLARPRHWLLRAVFDGTARSKLLHHLCTL
jgi:hypothetical protein